MKDNMQWKKSLTEIIPNLKIHNIQKSVQSTVKEDKNFIFVFSGKVHVYAYHSKIEEPTLIENIKAGAWISNSQNPTQLVLYAQDDLSLIYLNDSEVETIAKKNPNLFLTIYHEADKHYQVLLQRICYNNLNACARVKELLNSLFLEHKLIDLSHSELAMMIGLTRETVTRSLYKIEQQGLICMENRNITYLGETSYRLN